MHRPRNHPLFVALLLIIVGSAISSSVPEKKETEDKDEKEIDPKVAQDRSLRIGLSDQLAVESVQSYGNPGEPYPIPVPLPLPVHPGSILLPSLPLGSNKGGKISVYAKSVGGHRGGGGGHGASLSGSYSGGSSHGGKVVPPPIAYKQAKAPLTRSSNPSPVSHFSSAVSNGAPKFYPPPPPPPPQLPTQGYTPPQAPQPSFSSPPVSQQGYAPPPQNYAPPPPNEYAPPEGNYNPPPSNALPVESYSVSGSAIIPTYNVPSASHINDGYSGPKQSDIYEGRQPILNHGSRGQYEQPSQNIDQVHDNSYQALPQLGIPPSGFLSLDGDISGSAYVPPSQLVPDEPWATSNHDMPQIANINVKCDKNLMRVTIDFDRPFYGIIFSKGHYSNVNCVHLPAGLGKLSSTFDISINSCGTTGNTDNGSYGYGSQSGSGTFFENTLVIQYDPQVQEVWDQARKLRCTWHDQYEKSVTFKPFPVDMLDVVRADFAGDNVGCWMQIQVGKGPWASEVSGLVKIGQAMTMVLAIKDDDNKFDMLVRNCMAHDGKRAPIQLVDQRGCVTRPKLMSRFTKIKNFGASASVLSYAHFQAFKFPDSMEVHFQCTIQICRYQCPEQCVESSGHPQQPGTAYDVPAAVGQPRDNYRRKREANGTETEGEKDIGVNRIIQVVSTRDLSFLIDKNELVKEMKETDKETFVSVEEDPLGLICMSTPGFAATLVVLLSILIISCLLSAFLCLRFRGIGDTQSIISSYQNPAFLHKKRFF